jgi:hypothetical protein
MTWVAPKRDDCLVCDQSHEIWEAVNEALWDGEAPSQSSRYYGHASRAKQALASFGRIVDIRTIYRHRDHIERAARDAVNVAPRGRDRPIYATDFVSVTDKMASIGMQAADIVQQRMSEGTLEDKALVSVMQTGLRAAANRETASRADKAPVINIQAIFGVAGGYLRPPSNLVIEGEFSEADLGARIEEERGRLRELQQG